MTVDGDELPGSWVEAELSLVSRINPPLDRCVLNDDIEVNFVPMRAVEADGGGLAHAEMRAYGEVKKGYTSFLSGDVIMAKITPCMENGKTTVVPALPGDVCCGSTEFIVVRPADGIEGRWIAQFLLQHETRRAAQRRMTGGVGQMRVPASFVEALRLPIAPSAEQERIADTLDELFSDLHAAVAALERVRAKLKLYRASVLKAAVEGALTRDWREQHPDAEPAAQLLQRILAARHRRWEEDQLAKYTAQGMAPPKNWKAKYREPKVPMPTKTAAAPAGWTWATLDQLGRLDRGKSKHRPRDAAMLYGGPFPFIQTGDVRRARQYVREHLQSYSEAGLKQSRLWPAETLCITIAANIADTAILAYPACFPDSVVGGLFDPCLVSVRFVELFLRSAKEQIASYAPATAQKNINNDILRAVAMPLPPLAEQEAIVELVEDQLSVIDHLEADLDAKLESAQALRQAILRRAFAGKLVAQDPNDEPAAELLKRIAAERARSAPARPAAQRRGAKVKAAAS